jgi:hypothetical protein
MELKESSKYDKKNNSLQKKLFEINSSKIQNQKNTNNETLKIIQKI